MNVLNQYSYILFSLAAIAVIVVLLRRLPRGRFISVLVGGLLVVGAVVGWTWLRPGNSDVANLTAAESVIENGNPTLVEFFSNYCAFCITVRPTVDNLVESIETEYGDQFNILRVDIHTDFGRVLRQRYGFSFTPEFVLFDTAGDEIWRSHVPPTLNEINTALASSRVSTSSS